MNTTVNLYHVRYERDIKIDLDNYEVINLEFLESEESITLHIRKKNNKKIYYVKCFLSNELLSNEQDIEFLKRLNSELRINIYLHEICEILQQSNLVKINEV